MSGAKAITVKDVSFAWPSGDRVLKNCSLQVPQNQFWMLLGANGSGKSTLLKLMVGLLSGAAGIITVSDPIGFVFQNPDHQLVMPTVGADIAFGLVSEHLPHAALQKRVEESLQAVALDGYQRRPIYALSGGQKQRVAIAGELARRSKILLLDEPTALLDSEYQQELVSLVRNLVDQQSITALWVTHRLRELDYADGAFLLKDGQVVDQGDPARLRQLLEEDS